MHVSSVFLVVRIQSGPTNSRTGVGQSTGILRKTIRRPTHVRGVEMSCLERVLDNTYDAFDGVEICGAQITTEIPEFMPTPT